jgi:hypothetical protein
VNRPTDRALLQQLRLAIRAALLKLEKEQQEYEERGGGERPWEEAS